MIDARVTILTLLARRAPSATICPSEAARALATSQGDADWRARMPDVHAAAAALLEEQRVRLSWRGETRRIEDGPYRIGLGEEER